MSEKQIRINLTLKPGMHRSIESYADVMGIGVSEAARYLLMRGLEQVQLLRTSADSATALRTMTEVMEAEFQAQEAREKAKKSAKKKDQVLVTPDLRLKNETARNSKSRVKDIFND